MSKNQLIDKHDFMRMFNLHQEELPIPFLEQLDKAETTWRSPTQDELEAYILNVLQQIQEKIRQRSPSENQEAFEKGWIENYKIALEKGTSQDTLRPRYFRKNKYLRYNKTLIVSDNLNLEYDLFTLARYVIFYKYLSSYESIYEFGCGSCNNMLMLSEMFPGKQLHGFDWTPTSISIAKLLNDKSKCIISGEFFDILNPPNHFKIKPNSAVLTIHALEQLGVKYKAWIEFMLRIKPAIIVNYEPILEFYDTENLWDYLALLYSKKRGYLSGYYPALQKLAKKGHVEILNAQRPYLGGVIHEASLVVWRPV